MIDRYEIISDIEKTREMIELSQWIWNSHWWVELRPGYCECKWCGRKHSSEWSVSKDFPLCKENPAIQKLIYGGL